MTLPRLRNLGLGSADAYSVVATATDYLPEAVGGYLRLPREWADTRPIDGYKTSLMVLVDQLELLGSTMDKILDAANRSDAQALIAHGRFLQAKFGQTAGPDLTIGTAVSSAAGPTLAAALDALMAAAKDAGLDEHAARAEGEALSATIAEPSRGAFVDWSRETGRAESAQEFMDAASRGRRYRSAPTPSMAALALDGSVHAASYAEALSDVAMAACSLGEDNPRAVGNAATAAAAQLRGPGTTSPSLALGTPREPVPGPTRSSCPRSWTSSAWSASGSRTWGARQISTGSGGPSQRVPDQHRRRRARRGDPAEPEQPKEPEPPAKTVEELLAELDALVGLGDVKAEIHRQAAVLRVEGLRKDAGLRSPTITRHLIFDGNPGTGKTTVARLVAGIYRALGLLTKGQLVEVDRSELVAGFLGQTAIKTAEVVASAVGGVLFIDEAYSLSGDQYGTEAIDTLVKEMEDKREDLVVIVAGYPVPMAVFIGQNPGLESRFRTIIDFPDYTDDELVQIFQVMATDAEYDAGDEVLERLRVILAGVERGPRFGNARYVRNLLEAAIGRQAWRLRDVEKPTVAELRTLVADDLDPIAAQEETA